jgi:dihydroflavonol-4-reductase
MERLNLVTGATGFSASHVIRELLGRGEKVIGTDLPQALVDPTRAPVLAKIGLDLNHPNLKLVPANLLEPESLAPLFENKITHLFHTASLYDYSAPLDRLRKINVAGTTHLLEYAKKAELTQFIHWSTCGVFGKPYSTRSKGKVNTPFDEESSSPKNTPFGAKAPAGTHLVNAYSVSKWEQEQLLWKAHREEGLPLTVIRPAPIYGPGSTYGQCGLILLIAHGGVPFIVKDGKNYLNASVQVEDLARFALYLSDRSESIGEDYNVTDGSILSQHEFMHLLALVAGRRLLDIPLIPCGFLRIAFLLFVKGWMFLERKFGIRRLRMFEPQSAEYLGSSYWFSNRKSLETGFRYRYADVREGIMETTIWLRKMGWLYIQDKKLRKEILYAKLPVQK